LDHESETDLIFHVVVDRSVTNARVEGVGILQGPLSIRRGERETTTFHTPTMASDLGWCFSNFSCVLVHVSES
jgi:hypothetical protein